jgi:hypothetical protein
MSDSNGRKDVWFCRSLAALLILAAAVLHIAFLARNCVLDLSPDEAHYWLWSQNLDWSYYSKGPLVAYLIRFGTEVAGSLAVAWTGNVMLAVRLPAVICGSLLLVSLYVLTVLVYRRERLALGVVALALTLPPVAVGASLMTIDAPYTCLWGWALVAGYFSCVRRVSWAWPVAGLLVGIGILAKYTMVIWLPSAGLFLLFDRERRQLLFRPGFWVMTGCAAACCLPILIWNAQHDWVTVRHVFMQAGVEGTKGLKLFGPLRYVGTQFALLLGYWFVVWATAMVIYRPWKQADEGVRYLWWMSAPMFALFLAFSVRNNGGEPNWPVTAYLSGLVLAGAWLAQQLQHPSPTWRRLSCASLAVACSVGIGVTLLVHFATEAQPLLTLLSGPPTESRPLPLRRFDPTCRLRGWRYLAAEVDRIRAEVSSQDGDEPLLAGNAWTLPGELSFYCQGHPGVYSLGLGLGDRWSQFDLWRPNPVLDPNNFRGKTFILVGVPSDALREAFPGGVSMVPVIYEEKGQPIAFWNILVCRDYQGVRIPTVLRN